MPTVNSLTCFKNENFNHTFPGEEIEECEETKLCVRYVEVKEKVNTKDSIKCDTMEKCNKTGEVRRAEDTAIEYTCYKCDTDKCIPKATTDVEVTESTDGESSTVDNDLESTSINETTTTGSTTPFDDEDDQDDPDEILYSTERLRRNPDVSGSTIPHNYIKLVLFLSFIAIFSFIPF